MPMKFDGFEMLQKDFEQMQASMENTGDVLEKAAQPILQQMQANASTNIHVRSGDLSGSIGTQPYYKGITIGVHRKDWHGDEYYPAYVEFGHGGPHPAPPHPYIRPAIDAKGEEALDIMAKEIKDRIK